MADLLDLGVAEAAAAIRDGATTSTALVEAALARIEATDAELRAWVAVDSDGALAGAAARDEDLAAGLPAGALHGIPIGIKDIIDVAGMTTTAGAPEFAHRRPSRDATLVGRLRAAGAVIVGKTVATQFAFKDPAVTRNPWSADRTPGGSSSGSAAAVAARQVPAAIGTQTIGSMLRPSAFCGVVGLKGEHGAVPLDGVVPLAPSLDHAGPITRSVADAALIEGVLLGHSLKVPEVAPPRFVVAPRLWSLADPPLRHYLDTVLAELVAAGAEVVRQELPAELDDALEAGWLVLEAEAADRHRSMFADHSEGYGPQIAGLVRAGLERRAPEIARAQDARQAFRATVGPWLSSFDALLSPVAPGPAPRRGEGTGDPTLCAPWSYAGVPSIAIPTGLDSEGLPLALQLVGGPGRLERLLGAAARCERVVGFDVRPPQADNGP
jgi:Asp-tRNA(Asn)/Glu-tRNA(Gln) amidotransferase A subunit family amidase